jgi:hypothetical protein
VVTDAGRAALDDTHRWFGDLLDRALAGWAPDDVAALCAALGRFARDIGRTLVNHPAHDTTLEAAQ